jgi:NAD(P)-dependent dehydrogenase (short-subunit alcohol dehydrogenase family)
MREAAELMSMRFPARRAVITGGASGFGLAVARLLAVRGWHLLLVDLGAEALARSADELRAAGAAEVTTAACDVREAAALAAVIEGFGSRHGGLDFALNSAGVAAAGPFLETPPEDWRWSFDINVHGVVNSCRAEIPLLQRAGRGLIMNVASAASFCTGSSMSAYNSSKAAVVAFSETLMQEFGPQGIQTVAAMPGFFRTNLLAQARGPERIVAGARRIMEDSRLDAAAVAQVLLARAARGRTHLVYPGRYVFLWRLKRLMPQRFQTLFPRLALRTQR